MSRKFSRNFARVELAPRQVYPTARRHVQREKAWWLENRIHPDIFAAELEEVLQVVALLPGAGSAYPEANIPDLRRLYLTKSACHIYYTFSADQVIIHAAWGARQGRGPRTG